VSSGGACPGLSVDQLYDRADLAVTTGYQPLGLLRDSPALTERVYLPTIRK
jgi:hypothetical protein